MALPKVSSSDILKAISLDKKVKDGSVHYVLCRKVGQVDIKPVDPKAIRSELTRYRAVRKNLVRGGPKKNKKGG